ncbi:MAG: hypothetical protein AMXMBFR7_00510 [Planctomycetota bacterium]
MAAMPAASLIGKTRARLKALAEGVSGGGLTLAAERVVLGYARTLESGGFFANLLAEGPCLAIGSATLDYGAQAAYGPAEVRAILYVGFERGAAEDFTAVDDLLEALREAWNAPESFGSGEAAPIRIGWDAWKTETKSEPGVVAIPLRVQFPDPPLGETFEAEARLGAALERETPTILRTCWRYFVHRSRFEKLARFGRSWLEGS